MPAHSRKISRWEWWRDGRYLAPLVKARQSTAKGTRFFSRQDQSASQAGGLGADLIRLGLCHRKQDRHRSGVRAKSIDIRPLNRRCARWNRMPLSERQFNGSLETSTYFKSVIDARRQRFSEVFVENERFCRLVGLKGEIGYDEVQIDWSDGAFAHDSVTGGGDASEALPRRSRSASARRAAFRVWLGAVRLSLRPCRPVRGRTLSRQRLYGWWLSSHL